MLGNCCHTQRSLTVQWCSIFLMTLVAPWDFSDFRKSMTQTPSAPSRWALHHHHRSHKKPVGATSNPETRGKTALVCLVPLPEGTTGKWSNQCQWDIVWQTGTVSRNSSKIFHSCMHLPWRLNKLKIWFEARHKVTSCNPAKSFSCGGIFWYFYLNSKNNISEHGYF